MSAALSKRPLGAWSSHSGPHSIIGTVKKQVTPAENLVNLFEQRSLKLIATTRSVGGNYAFEKVKAGRWLVLAIDDTAQYNAVVVDRVVTG